MSNAAKSTALNHGPCDDTRLENHGFDKCISVEDSVEDGDLDRNVLDGSPGRDSLNHESLHEDSRDVMETGRSVDDVIHEEAGSDIEDTEVPTSSQSQGQKRAEQPRRQRSVHLSYEHFQAMKAMVEAVQRIFESHSHRAEDRPADSRKHQKSLKPPESLLTFPIDFTTLPDNNHDSYGGNEAALEPSVGYVVKRRARGRPRRWTDYDQQRLQSMKQKGCTDERIGLEMGRSLGAIIL